MENSYNKFLENIESVKTLHSLHSHFVKLLPAMDLSEILRAEIVLVVSALDCFIHDIAREGLLKLFYTDTDKSTNYKSLSIPMPIVKQLIMVGGDEQREVLQIGLKKVLSKDSYQSTKGIEYALSLMSIKSIWSKVGQDLDMSANDVKLQLGLIVNRRNKIAHEADLKNYMDKVKSEIDREELDYMINFVSKVVESIYYQVKDNI